MFMLPLVFQDLRLIVWGWPKFIKKFNAFFPTVVVILKLYSRRMRACIELNFFIILCL